MKLVVPKIILGVKFWTEVWRFLKNGVIKKNRLFKKYVYAEILEVCGVTSYLVTEIWRIAKFGSNGDSFGC